MKITNQIVYPFIFIVFLAMITGTVAADNVSMELVGHLGGPVNNVAVAGGYCIYRTESGSCYTGY